jgi:hypothetical protein
MLTVAVLAVLTGAGLFGRSRVAHYEKLERMTDAERADYYRRTGK